MERVGVNSEEIMKRQDVLLIVILVGLIVFFAFDLREGGSGISSHIAGVFRMLFFSGTKSSSRPIVALPATTSARPSQSNLN